MENVIRLIRSNDQCTPTQVSLATIDASISSSAFDVLNFCSENEIDTSNFLATARLFQVADFLEDFWKNAKENNESMQDLRDPDVLYKSVVRFVKNQGGR